MAPWILLLMSTLLIRVWTPIQAFNDDLCPARCLCEDEFFRVVCICASLEVVPIQLNPEIKHLDLSNNRIGSISLAFNFYSNLEVLNLSDNILHTLGTDSFLLQHQLISLNVSNNAIRSLSKNSLKGLESLQILDLSRNNISDIDASAFHHVSKLDLISLSENSLTSLPDNLLANIHSIRTLQLSKNSLLDVPISNLEQIPTIQNLDLSNNLIKDVSDLPPLRSLTSLNLANNVIKSIAEDAFDGLPALLILNLQGNNLAHVPTIALSKLNVLASLSLAKNPLRILNALAFRNLFELKMLDLRKCKISLVHPKTFADNVNLENIVLDSNHELQHLPSRVLYMAKHLRVVSLKNCSLSTLEPTYFPLDSLTNLMVAGNPIVCNCSIHWLWNMIHTENLNSTKLYLDSQGIFCSDPEFSGKSLMTLSESSLHCSFTPLYLTLTVAGCLVAAAIILSLIACITHGKRRKRAPFTPINHPELLIYVDSVPDDARKYSVAPYLSPKQMLESHNSFYDLARGEKSYQQPRAEALYDTAQCGPASCTSHEESDYQNAGTSASDEGYMPTNFSEIQSNLSKSSLYRHGNTGNIKLDHNRYNLEDDYEYPQRFASEFKPQVAFV